ncbi:MAG: glycosyltransferase family 2 protein [Syntrophobacteraceae bacterium]
MPIELSVIIVNWNSVEHLKRCVPTLFSGSPGENIEVIVVDNASYDGSERFLKDNYPGVHHVQGPSNLGFARGNNLGFSHSHGKYLLFLNPDTEIIGPALSRMLGALKNSENAAIIGARLLNSDGSLQTSCVQAFPTVLNQFLDSDYLRRIFPSWRLWGTDALMSRGNGPTRVQMVSGACLMINRRAFESLGLFATDYFMYAEDLDLCYKCARAGWDVLYQGEAEVFHHGGGSAGATGNPGFSAVLTRESLLTFMKKYYGQPFPLLFRASTFINASLRLLALAAVTPAHMRPSQFFIKWHAVLRWSLGLEKWAEELNLSTKKGAV